MQWWHWMSPLPLPSKPFKGQFDFFLISTPIFYNRKLKCGKFYVSIWPWPPGRHNLEGHCKVNYKWATTSAKNRILEKNLIKSFKILNNSQMHLKWTLVDFLPPSWIRKLTWNSLSSIPNTLMHNCGAITAFNTLLILGNTKSKLIQMYPTRQYDLSIYPWLVYILKLLSRIFFLRCVFLKL